MPAEVDSAIDVALWFSDQALNRNEYLQPQKLHKLLFVAQAYFAVAYRGRMLMPCIFVAEELGPIEPNLYKIFARGRPDVDPELFLSEAAEEFLRGIWRRFGHFTASRLARITNGSEAYSVAWKRGRRTEISLSAMRLAFVQNEDGPDVSQIVRPKVLRTATGRPVMVQAWAPSNPPAKLEKPAARKRKTRNAEVKKALEQKQRTDPEHAGQKNIAQEPESMSDSPVLNALAEEFLAQRRRAPS